MKKILIAAILAVISGMTCAQASESVMYSTYDFSTDTVTITGNTDNMKALISFILLPEETELESLTPESINQNKYVTYELRNESDGSFEVKLQLPVSAPGGKYNVYAFCGDETLSSQFTYLSGTEVEKIVDEINNSSAGGTAEIIRNNSLALGVDDSCIQYIDQIAEILKGNQPSGGFSAEEFISEMNRCSAIVLIRNDVDLDEIIRNFGAALGDELKGEIESLDDDLRKSFFEAVKVNEIDGDSVQFFYRCIMMSKIANSASYVEMSSYLNQYNKSTGMNADLSRANVNTYKSLFNSNITTYKALEASLKSFIDSQSSSTSGGGGGGGGGGGVSSAATSSGATPGKVAVSSGGTQNKPSQQDNDISSEQTYTDISGHWAEECIKRLSEKDIISGYDDGSFRPDNNITRAEFVKLIISAMNIPESGSDIFTDVSENDWYYGCISAGAERGIIDGYGDEFRPNDQIIRQDAAVIIFRVLNIPATSETAIDYDDADDISDYAKESVNTLTAENILNGSDGSFMPGKQTTRAEAAAMIEKMLDYEENRR